MNQLRGTCIVLCVAAYASLAGPAFSQNQWANGLLAYWSFDEGSGGKVGDYKVTTPGTKNGATTWLTGANARFGAAMRFDSSGTNNKGYVALPPGGALANPNTDAMTLSVWVRSDVAMRNMPAKTFASIFNSTRSREPSMSHVSDNYIMYYDAYNAELRAKFSNAEGKYARPGVPAAEVPVGKWYHVAAVYDGTGAAIYLNGVKKGVVPLSGPLRNGQVSAIGRKGTTDDEYWNGDIDDLAIWTRALSASEIATLAAGTSPLSQFLGPASTPSSATSIQTPGASAPKLTLYYFFLPEHKPSREFYDTVIRKSANYDTISRYNVVVVNMQTQEEEAAKYEVIRSPTIVIGKPDGTSVWKHTGLPEEGQLLTELKRLAK